MLRVTESSKKITPLRWDLVAQSLVLLVLGLICIFETHAKTSILFLSPLFVSINLVTSGQLTWKSLGSFWWVILMVALFVAFAIYSLDLSPHPHQHLGWILEAICWAWAGGIVYTATRIAESERIVPTRMGGD